MLEGLEAIKLKARHQKKPSGFLAFKPSGRFVIETL
jgi:hypothetical protein